MKVRELIEELQKLDPEMECIIQKDAEGNGFSPLAGADPNGIYIKETSWFGEVYSAEWTADEADMDEDLWETMLKKPRCLVLYPVN